MNFQKKKFLLVLKWIKNFLPCCPFFFVCYIKPSNKNKVFQIRKNIKFVKVISIAVFKASFFFEELARLRFFSGKLVIVFFKSNDLTKIKNFLNILKNEKFLIPILFYNSTRFLQMNSLLLKSQLNFLDMFGNVELFEKNNLQVVICSANLQLYNVLLINKVKFYKSMNFITKNEKHA